MTTAKAVKENKVITKETLKQWYETMLLIRRFEERAGVLFGQQKIRGFLHLYIGQEAVAAGTISAIRKEDPVITAYRDHGLALAKGVSANECMAELFGKSTGCSKGRGGSMHFFSKEHYFLGGHAIVGAHIPLAAGIAFAEKYKGTDNVCICFFGDGAVRQGALHETFNLAVLWELPVVFVCENNQYAMGTSVSRSSHARGIYKLGEPYDMPSVHVDGMKCEAVHEAMSKAVKHARDGKGPSFLEVVTYRYRGHSMSDPAKYRTREEVEEYKKHDPIEQVKETLLKKKFATQKDVEAMEEAITKTVDECVEFAEQSPFPQASELYDYNYVQQDYPFITD